MMMAVTKKEVMDTLNSFFGDTTRSQAETRSELEEIVDEIEVMIDMLDVDEDESGNPIEGDMESLK
jgi:hypothetical protein